MIYHLYPVLYPPIVSENNTPYPLTMETKVKKVLEEEQYLTLLRTIVETGFNEQTRNGNCRTIFGYQMRFSLKEGYNC